MRKIYLSLALALCLSACGLDNIVYLVPVNVLTRGAGGASGDTVSFLTSDSENSSLPVFKGYEVLYLIYHDEDECKKDRNYINNYNENNPSESAKYIQTSKNYKKLQGDTEPLVLPSGSNDEIEIQLNRTEKKVIMKRNSGTEIPLKRDTGVNGKQDFFVLAENPLGECYKTGNGGHGDLCTGFEYDENEPNLKFYVSLYAVTCGINESLSPIYSELVDLGYFEIEVK